LSLQLTRARLHSPVWPLPLPGTALTRPRCTGREERQLAPSQRSR
jgi:hypothetical protein